ncbi:hypothetical protein MTR67_040083 [Solanum verrucosum]|uniref:Uncharacterized protein n=1 Tax=Solanum verrucosum TaxID=315347 RepID=A0AAF0ZR26_SOLVR|nr:hypothetical protein MTR67_040083 [Solanum verrucosum]
MEVAISSQPPNMLNNASNMPSQPPFHSNCLKRTQKKIDTTSVAKGHWRHYKPAASPGPRGTNRGGPALKQRDLEQGGGTGRNRQGDNWEKVSLIRDKFEYDRERRMREKAFAPMSAANNIGMDYSTAKYQASDTRRYISDSDSDSDID